MKGAVKQVEGIEVVACACSILTLEVFLKAGNVIVTGEFGGPADACTFESLTNELGVANRLRVDSRDKRSKLRDDFNQTIVPKARNGFSHWRPTHSELTSELVLG